MSPAIESALQRLEAGGWLCSRTGAYSELPEVIRKRYPWVPTAVSQILCELEELVSPDETEWLLTAADYSDQSDIAFTWDAWERLSLEAAKAQKDEEWAKEIRTFWDNHLPISLSVADGYAYHALRSDGTVVYGREPKFEQTSHRADDFESFLQRIGK